MCLLARSPPCAPCASHSPHPPHPTSSEEALFNEGMKQGARDALSRLDAELDRQVQAAYLRSSLKDEDERRLALNAELDRLSRSYYR